MKYSKTKLARAVVYLKSLAQDGISNAPNGDIPKDVAEDIMIVLDRLSKLEKLAAGAGLQRFRDANEVE